MAKQESEDFIEHICVVEERIKTKKKIASKKHLHQKA